jgi:D-alanine--D-alanine ligase
MEGNSMELRLIYNLRSGHPGKKDGAPFDVDADWDIPDTISHIKKTLEKVGFNVIDICCDYEIVTKLAVSDSLVFSICEMVGGAYREALIPSLCEILGIPYVFSSPDVMVKTLDKNLCNLVVQKSKINVPDWIYIKSIEDVEALTCLNKYPYIVKPAFEGSGMGISDQSVLYSYTELVHRVDYTISAYKQPVLVQRYIDGIELTVGILGEGRKIEVLAPVEVHLPYSKVYGYEQKENASTQASYSLSTNDLINKEIIAVSRKIYQVLGCRDAARMDFRFDTTSDMLYFIEVNPLPHLHPDIGDFCRSAYGAGYTYEALLKKICNHAISRSSS